MDRHTFDKLEFHQVRRLLAAQARTALGRALADTVAPSADADLVQRRLDEVRQFLALTRVRGLPPFGGITDVRPLIRCAIPPATLDPEQFGELASALYGIHHLRRYFEGLGADFPLIERLAARIGDFASVADRIDSFMDRRGRVRDDATPRLARVRQRSAELKRELHAVFDRLLRQSSILRLLQYPNATFHADRMVLPLKADHRGRIPGIIHRSSDTGQTLFVEPTAAVELNNALIQLARDEHDEIGRILWDLTHLVHLNQTALLRTLDAVALVDLLTAKVQLAARFDMTLPRLNREHRLNLRAARHPLLLAQRAAEAAAGRPAAPVVPIDVRLGEDFDLLVVTGPNTGGKTVALKTVGLLALMTQAALPIPAAEGSTLPAFDNVLVDIGDEQSLQQSLSTFSAHLARLLEILHHGTRHTLVLADELGAGTDPDDGAALGRAILERLLDLGALAIVTTHLGALKAIAFEHPRVDNAAVLFDFVSLRPTYELRIGEPGNSNALIVAARLGMPLDLISAAQRFLAGRDRALARAIAGTVESRREAEKARRDAEAARDAAAREQAAAEDARRRLTDEQQRFNRWVARIANLRPGDTVRVRRFDRDGTVVHVRLDRQLVTVAVGPLHVEVPLTDLLLDDAPGSG